MMSPRQKSEPRPSGIPTWRLDSLSQRLAKSAPAFNPLSIKSLCPIW